MARTRHPKIVAIGEAGLDYHYDFSPREAQERGFRRHIAAARETGLPLVIHSREADADMARSSTEETGKGAFPAVLHCFTGGRELAQRAIALGLYISFTGILTFKRSDELRAIAAELPADRILVETDAPYLAPGKFRGKRNEPAYVVEIAKVLAATRRRLRRRDRAPDHGEFLPPVQQGAAELRPRRHDAFTVTHPRLRLSGGVPRPGLGWGHCDPANPKNRRRRCSCWWSGATPTAADQRPDRHLAGFARAAPGRRASIGWTACSLPMSTPTIPMASTICAGCSSRHRRRIDVYLDEPT